MATEEEEDFSFPLIITENHPSSSIDSPPLWHLSPAASPVHSSNKQEEEEDCFTAKSKEHYNIYKQRKSCSNIDDDPEEEEEERMDILWEDFNEELSRNYSESCSKLETKSRNTYSSGTVDTVELGCVQSLKLSKNGALFSSRKPGPAGILVFIKVFKKLLLQNSRPSVKNNRPW